MGILDAREGTIFRRSWHRLRRTEWHCFAVGVSRVIGADGTATLHANALTGPEKYNFQYQGAGPVHAQAGKPYAYDIAAQFKGRHGTGKRIGGRIGIFDFVKD